MNARRHLAGWFARGDLAVLLAVLAAVLGVLVFLVVADRVMDGPPGHLDEWLLRALREPSDPSDPLGPRWLEEAGRDVTALGGYTVLTLLVGLVTGYLLAARRAAAAGLILVSTLGGVLLSQLLKGFYARPRPGLVPHLARVATESFPSGHAMLSAVVYLTLGALLARLIGGRWARLYFVGAAIVLTGLVGASRVYLGVHYPTDVVAGWAAGLSWAVLCWLGGRTLQRYGVLGGGND